MAGLLRRAAAALSLAAALAAAPAAAQPLPPGYHDRPLLVVDPGRHTARIWRADVDAAGRFLVTASEDKTVRVWNAGTGALERTLRLPAGPGHVGKAYAVAISPDGALIAAGGWTAPPTSPEQIFLYRRETGAVAAVIPGLPEVVNRLAFSPDGRFLAATLGWGGLRVFDRDAAWREVRRDEGYRDQSSGAAFARDGRLATTSYDGMVRLYAPGPGFAPIGQPQQAPGGRRPFGIAFSPEGGRLAIGYDDTTRVDVLDGHTLAPLFEADTRGIDNGSLGSIAWGEGGTLLAAGRYADGTGNHPVLAWAGGGRGPRRALPAGLNTAMSLLPLGGGDVIVAAQDPWLGRLGPDGAPRWVATPPIADYRGQRSTLAASEDGSIVAFGFEPWGEAPAWFDLSSRSLAQGPPPEGRTAPPVQQGLPVAGWINTPSPTLGGRPLRLEDLEWSRSLAIHPDGARFVLGAEWSLRAFSAAGKALWRVPVPDTAWAVTISGDGRLVIAAYGDGTIRWHRMDDGRELLAFMPLADRGNWIAWTPEGYFDATPAARRMLLWHRNRADFATLAHPVADIPGFYRPRLLPHVLREMETVRAIGLADEEEQTERLDLLSPSSVRTGARLHLLGIGINYTPSGRHTPPARLKLDYAVADIDDLADKLERTQAHTYMLGRPGEEDLWRNRRLNERATKAGILDALEALLGRVQEGDLAVVHFSGHGAMINDNLYLLPYDVDMSRASTIRATALPMTMLRDELEKIARRNARVLVLIDACHAGGATRDERVRETSAARLSQALASVNISVLASSSASQASREDPTWQNGAFTEAVLEALDGAADGNRDGLLSGTELAEYVERRVRALTDGRQSPAMELRFGGTLFAVR
jgi:hypothetical protein